MDKYLGIAAILCLSLGAGASAGCSSSDAYGAHGGAIAEAPPSDEVVARAPESLEIASAEDTHVTGESSPARGSEALVQSGPSCAAADLKITRFPLNGVNGHDWLINNYLDLDGNTGATRDYLGFTGDLARTYDGHAGLDIDIPSFREMDSGAAVVYAVAPGTVEDVVDDQSDRNMIGLSTCTAQWNVVKVRHANGYALFYGHIKKGSARVTKGSVVSVGQALATAGSSGCSTQPHLHFEVQSCTGTPVETMLSAGTWSTPPVYTPTSDVMEIVLRAGGAPDITQIKDPAPNPDMVSTGTDLGVGLSLAAKGGDVVNVILKSPAGSATTYTWTIPGSARVGHQYGGWHFPLSAAVGTWTVTATVNGRTAATSSVRTCTNGVCPAPKCVPLECNAACRDCNSSRGTCSFNKCVCASKAYCR